MGKNIKFSFLFAFFLSGKKSFFVFPTLPKVEKAQRHDYYTNCMKWHGCKKCFWIHLDETSLSVFFSSFHPSLMRWRRYGSSFSPYGCGRTACLCRKDECSCVRNSSEGRREGEEEDLFRRLFISLRAERGAFPTFCQTLSQGIHASSCLLHVFPSIRIGDD